LINPQTEARTLRLILAFFESDAAGCADAVTRILAETDCDTPDLVLMLLTILTREIDGGGHRSDWEAYIQSRLLGRVGPVPDTIADLD
jgi:hypothetical protein